MTLPLNCTVSYHKNFLSKEECNVLFDQLLNIYHIDQLNKMHLPDGKSKITQHGKLMFTDQELFDQKIFPELIWEKTPFGHLSFLI